MTAPPLPDPMAAPALHLLLLEWTAVALNVLFTLYIAWEKRLGWGFGLLAAIISVGLYLRAHTWAMGTLNAYYVAMAIYGWRSWGRKEGEGRIRLLPMPLQALLVVAGLVLSYVVYFFLQGYLNGRQPGLDAFVTVFSFLATWMMARKYITCWYWFIVADSVSIGLNWQVGYQGFAALNAMYLVLSVVGLVKWGRLMKQQGRMVNA